MTTKMRFPAPALFIRSMRVLADRLESGDLVLDQFIDFSSLKFTEFGNQTDIQNRQSKYSFELYVSKKGSK